MARFRVSLLIIGAIKLGDRDGDAVPVAEDDDDDDEDMLDLEALALREQQRLQRRRDESPYEKRPKTLQPLPNTNDPKLSSRECSLHASEEVCAQGQVCSGGIYVKCRGC